MARKFEMGLKYFPHDTDMAYDRNIRKLTKSYGAVGYAVWTRLLECIYANGHYIHYCSELAFDIADSINMDDDTIVNEIVNECVEIGLFDKDMFSFFSVLTSCAIQERYFFAKEQSIKRSVSKNNTPEYDFLLINIKELLFKQNPKPMIGVNDEGFIGDDEIRPVTLSPIVEMPSIKPKQKEQKEDAEAALKKREGQFAETLKPFLETYGRDMLNDFYLYWTEPNKSRTKMRFENEKTWDVSRRLRTWNKNNFNKTSKNGTTHPTVNKQSLIEGLAAISQARRQSECSCLPEGLQ